MKKKLLFTHRIHDAGMKLALERRDVDVVVAGDSSVSTLKAAIRDAAGIVVRSTPITSEIIDAAERLLVVSRHGVGYDAVDVDALTARGIPLTITPEANATSVAEHTMFMLLALAKQCALNDADVRNGEFAQGRLAMRNVDLGGKTLLIVGFGRIGRRVAPLAIAFGMQVYACDPYVDQGAIERAGCRAISDFRSVLAQVDALSVHTPLTEETRRMIGSEELAALRPAAFLINTARGGIVDEDALADALATGRLAGAGVDVFESEPESPDREHALFRCPNVIFSPHCAGVSLQAGIRMGQMAVRNALAAFDGALDPSVVVNREAMLARAPTP